MDRCQGSPRLVMLKVRERHCHMERCYEYRYHPGEHMSKSMSVSILNHRRNVTHKNVASALDKLSHCIEDVKRWLSTNKLKLNPDKTEFIVFGSKSQRKKLSQSFPVNILGNLISPIDAVRNLGVWFDSDFSFSCHVMKVCKACFAHVRDLKRLRGHLTHEAALMAANALVGG